MINFREIFNMSYGYLGLVLIGIFCLILIIMDKKESVKVLGICFGVAGIFLMAVYFLGNMFVSSFSYKFFIEVISDNFFRNIIIFSGINLFVSGISMAIYKYVL